MDETRARRARRKAALAAIQPLLDGATLPVRLVVLVLFATFFLVVTVAGSAAAILCALVAKVSEFHEWESDR